jgi:hypothetical protein
MQLLSITGVCGRSPRSLSRGATGRVTGWLSALDGFCSSARA